MLLRLAVPLQRALAMHSRAHPVARARVPTCPSAAAPQALKRKLAARKAFVPWGGGQFVPLKLKVPPKEPLPLPEPPLLGAGAGAGANASLAAPLQVDQGVSMMNVW